MALPLEQKADSICGEAACNDERAKCLQRTHEMHASKTSLAGMVLDVVVVWLGVLRANAKKLMKSSGDTLCAC